VDVRPVNDRANMARMARDAVDVRCLGTIGGLLGIFLAIVVVGWFGQTIGPAAVVFAVVLVPLGWWLGVRTALGLLAR
jgi:hypothetical protein